MSSSFDDRLPGVERLARLYRFSLESEVTEATRALLKQQLLAELGLGAASGSAPAGVDAVAAPTGLTPGRSEATAGAATSDVDEPAPTEPARAAAVRALKAKAGAVASAGATTESGLARPALSTGAATPAAPAARPASLVRTPEHLELKIRQLVEADAGWERIGPLALALFDLRRDAVAAARVVELAFLHASTAEIEALLQEFKQKARDFYRHIHPAVRAHLVARLWRESAGDTLAGVLFRDRDEVWLTPIERLFLFESMATAKDAATPFIYFRRYKGELLGAVAELGAYVGLVQAAFLLQVGRLAIDVGDDAEARELLEQIDAGEPERDEALRLLLDVAVERNKAGRSHYVELLTAAASPAERLRLLGQFLAATRGLGGFRDRNRPALNEIMKDPLAWLGDGPELWATLSELIVAHRNLDALLPNLFEVFRANAVRFHAPLLDQALWQGTAAVAAETARDGYWRGVGLLHHFVAAGPAAEAALWEAKALVTSAKRAWQQPLPFAWRELQKAAYAWVAKSHYLLEADRARMLQQLRVAVDPEAVAIIDLEQYVEQAETAPLPVLAALQALAAAKAAPALESRLILKRAQHAHLTNADLNRLWQLANERREPDLAWRVATVLQARQALAASVRAAWEISGEKRAHYAFQNPPKIVVDRCLKGFPPRAARLAYASLHVGPMLPELLALLDPGATVTRAVPAPLDSVEARVDKALATLAWLQGPRRRYRFSFEAAAGATALPAFMHVLPANPWSLIVARLAEHFGLNAWGWKLSRLNSQIVDLIPRLASRQDLRRHSGKVAKWLKDLTPEQRAAWQDLATLSRSLEDEEAAAALAIFLCRLATVVLPHHLQALTSLHAMRAPAVVIWDLEAWLLSDVYSEVRGQLGTRNRVLVPNALQRLTTIVG